jgi:ABC-type transport system involved in cytochrome bd biosynthesis fused ATPase/permease subunit
MQLAGGTASVRGRIAFVPQKPWCQFGTLRDNILFGQPWDEARYRRVLHACALERDLDIMADGDLTEIGERGANISGGQAQRIVSLVSFSDSDMVVRGTFSSFFAGSRSRGVQRS